MHSPEDAHDHLVWIACVLAFTLAAATGALFRFGVAYGFTGGLNFANVRHAHSHLMYFAWVTPALFHLISRRIEALTNSATPQISHFGIGASLVLGFASYVPFLLFGYSSVSIGPLEVPPSVIIAGLNMLAWYGYILGYLRQTKGLERIPMLVLFDGSLLFLVLSSLGAWGISMIVPLGVENPAMMAALTHIFLGFFTEGWLTLAVLGLAISLMPVAAFDKRLFMAAVWMLVAGVAGSFLLGMPQSMMSPVAQILARVASGFMAVGLAIFALRLFSKGDGSWRASNLFLSLKALGFTIVLVTPSIWWADYFVERVLYFHIHLLGFTTLGIMAAAKEHIARQAGWQISWMNRAITGVIFSLVPMTLVEAIAS